MVSLNFQIETKILLSNESLELPTVNQKFQQNRMHLGRVVEVEVNYRVRQKTDNKETGVVFRYLSVKKKGKCIIARYIQLEYINVYSI